jgi:glycosyltransferase involved in cell wall biosynthesis
MSAERISVAVVSEPGKAGVKTHVIDLLTHIDLDRFKVAYFYSLQRSDAAYPAELAALRARGIECCELPMNGTLHFLPDLRALWRLVFLLRRFKPAVLHLHSSKAGGLGRLASLFVHPRPFVVYTPHAMACYRSRFYLWLEQILGWITDVTVAVSASEKRDFIRWRIPHAERAETIRLGLRASPSQVGLSAGSPAPGGRWVAGACGRISYQKNALLFFQVALAMLRSHPDYRFKWIGDFADDPEAQAVRELLALAGNPPQIEITGWVTDPRLHLETLDVFCMFSRYESFGYVTAEAMLLGVPVLATPASGTVDLIQHEVTGLLAAPEVDAIVATLGRLLADAPLRAELAGRAARFVTENHTIEAMVVATERQYAQARPA